MIRINQLKLRVDYSETDLKNAIAKKLLLDKNAGFEYTVVRRSLDARKKPELFYVFSINVIVDNEKKIVKRVNDNNIMLTERNEYIFPHVFSENAILNTNVRPVIVGFGPAGMFAALYLTRAGLKPIIIERGEAVEERDKSVNTYWESGVLNTESNVQFGEGGAGTFSDGKLNTLIKDPSGRIARVLKDFVNFGANEEILYVNKPHVGTDVLRNVVRNLRNEVLSRGGEILFNTKLTQIITDNGHVSSIDTVNVKTGISTQLRCDRLVLALGHSARDTFAMLNERGFGMAPKAFAVGLRIQHSQELINEYTYGKNCKYNLPAADYKITANTKKGRGVYSFCMCPGGYVVNASSESEMIAVNGMSYSQRDSENANSALIVTVTPQDYQGTDALSGVRFQQNLEKLAYRAGEGKIPVQLLGDFRENVNSGSLGRIKPMIKGEYILSNIRNVLPEFINESLLEVMPQFDKQIRGFYDDEAVLAGVESRTSSPLRITRDETFQSNIKGVFPCGEGAGYAGGITSAAVDGIKTAENVAKSMIIV